MLIKLFDLIQFKNQSINENVGFEQLMPNTHVELRFKLNYSFVKLFSKI